MAVKEGKQKTFRGGQIALWMGALVVGGVLGWTGVGWLNELLGFVATVYTRLFQFVAVPTIALAVVTTLQTLSPSPSPVKGEGSRAGSLSLGNKPDGSPLALYGRGAGGEGLEGVLRIFLHTLTYTLLTTVAAAAVGLLLFVAIRPDNLPLEMVSQGETEVPENLGELSYYGHILSVVPNNVVEPFAKGNVLSILFIAAAVGLALAMMPKTENVKTLLRGVFGLQELLFTLIRGLIWALPLGIVAFAAQLSAEVEAGVVVGSLGRYVAVILGGNLIQFFVVLPLFLLCRGLNPLRVLKAMSPAVLMALFTKSSAATLPVTMQSAEERLGVRSEVARFVLPICTTINMNGCAAFILVTSLFVMQNGGVALDWGTMLLWLFIAVVSAIGNAGVPMGCYFLTLSLMAGIGAPIGIMGIILPIFTVIDMVETAENVWSDSCVCAIVNKS